MQIKSLTILHAEDDQNDVLLLKRALRQSGVEHRIFFVNHGDEAIAYLSGQGEFANRVTYPFPNVLILDLKMPKKTGLEVLQWLKRNEECAVIPTIVLTSSAQPDDIKTSYKLGANAYFTKPNSMEHWKELFRVILTYWSVAHVPENPPDNICR